MVFMPHNKRKSILGLSGESGAGFTLIELVVVLAIFFIILAAMVDVFISMVKHQRRILEEQELLNQMVYVTEYMSTALKAAAKDPTGTCLGAAGNIYVLTHCTGGIASPCNGVKFINQLDGNACQEFFLDEAANPSNPPLREIKNGGAPQNILADKFKVKYGRFVLNGDKTLHTASIADLVQPRITFLLDVQSQMPGTALEKIIQTTVSQRNLNAP